MDRIYFSGKSPYKVGDVIRFGKDFQARVVKVHTMSWWKYVAKFFGFKVVGNAIDWVDYPGTK